MTEQFVTLEEKDGIVTFGDNGQGYISGIGNIQITLSTFIENVLYLKHNLISISQLCDRGLKVSFECTSCLVINPVDNSTVLIGNRQGNVYLVDLNDISNNDHCLVAIQDKINEASWLWHRRLGRASIHLITKLIKNDLVKEIPNLIFEEDKVYDVCQWGKQTKNILNLKMLYLHLGH